MKNLKKILPAALAVFFIFSFLISCKTDSSNLKAAAEPKAVLIKHPERMFGEIKTSTSSIYILGTIHFADKDFYPLEDKILEAFDKADVLVNELGGQEEMKGLEGKFQAKMLQNINFNPEKDLTNFLSEDEINIVRQELGDDIAIQLFKFNPWILTMALTQGLYTKAELYPHDGVDMHLINRADKRKIEGLESIDEQLDLISSGNFEEQVKDLKNTINSLLNIDQTVDLITTIKKLYLENNSSELTKFIGSLLDMSEGISKDALLKNRNMVWADKFEAYLKKESSTFVFAGLAHFLGEDSVFEQMRVKGVLE